MALKLRRGPATDRLNGFIPAVAELIFDTTTSSLYIGDGVTPGGVAVGGDGVLSDLLDVDLIAYNPTNLSNVEISGSTVLILTTVEAHGIAAGEEFVLYSTALSGYNGSLVADVVPDSTTIQVTIPAAIDAGPLSDLGNVTKVGYNLNSGTLLSYNSSTGKWVPLAPPVVNNSLFVYDTGASGWSNTTFELGSIGGVDLTVPPNLNETLTYNGTSWSAKDISATQGTGRGDAGNFTTEGDYGFVSNIYGGGNFTTGSDDAPAELSGLMDGGQF
jgi:hypothetical protein